MINIRFPTQIKIKSNILNDIHKYLLEIKAKKLLIVTDRNLVNLGFFKDILDIFTEKKIPYSVFCDTSGNPLKSEVEKGVENFHLNNCDSLLIIGGGCALDVGKAVALMTNHEGDLFDYEDGKLGAKEIKDQIPSMIAIPTTAGTGSEVGGSSVISDDISHKKYIIWSPYLVPKLVLSDPNILIHLPPHVTAATGIDALSHNLEAFLVNTKHPFADGIALEGISLIHKSLIKSYQNPSDLSARTDMLLASMMGATAFQKGLGVVHSCAHALSTLFDLHHGLSIAMMLRQGIKFNLECTEDKIKRLGRIINPDIEENKAISSFFDWLDKLHSELKLPANLSELKVNITTQLIETAYNDSCHLSNPRKCSKEDFKHIFNESL